jgi:Arc/MetJ family transcription regulator
MTKTLIDIDDDLLAEVAREFGTTTKKDTVAASLRRTAEQARERRLRSLDQLRAAAAAGVFDFDRLAQLDE